jgi:hypothetical protein
MAINSTNVPVRGSRPHSNSSRRAGERATQQRPTDDEILGLVTTIPSSSSNNGANGPDSGSPAQAAQDSRGANRPVAIEDEKSVVADSNSPNTAEVSPKLAPILEEHPELREAWDAAHAYQAVFATPAAARDARQQLDELDAMFFSSNPADHAALAARIHELSPEAFHGLAHAMHAHATKVRPGNSSAQTVSGIQDTGDAKGATGTADTATSNTAPGDATVPASASSSAPAAASAPVAAAGGAGAPMMTHPVTQQQAPDPHRAVQAAYFMTRMRPQWRRSSGRSTHRSIAYCRNRSERTREIALLARSIGNSTRRCAQIINLGGNCAMHFIQAQEMRHTSER